MKKKILSISVLLGLAFLLDSCTKSVRRLYVELPGMTRVYPGHGEFTDIGTEKRENEEITVDAVTIKN